jgi:hypothetical protein
MRLIIILSALFWLGTAFGQADTIFVLGASFGAATAPTDSTYTVTSAHPVDQLGQAFTPAKIQVGYQLIDAYGRLFRVKTVDATAFGSSTLTVVELQNSAAPSGSGLIYRKPDNSDCIPEIAAGNTGISPVLAAKIANHNAVNGCSAGEVTAAILNDSMQVVRDSLAAVRADIGTGGVTGSGTVNIIPKFTAAGVIGNSAMTESGGILTIPETVKARDLQMAENGGSLTILSGEVSGTGAKVIETNITLNETFYFNLELSFYIYSTYLGNARAGKIYIGGLSYNTGTVFNPNASIVGNLPGSTDIVIAKNATSNKLVIIIGSTTDPSYFLWVNSIRTNIDKVYTNSDFTLSAKTDLSAYTTIATMVGMTVTVATPTLIGAPSSAGQYNAPLALWDTTTGALDDRTGIEFVVGATPDRDPNTSQGGSIQVQRGYGMDISVTNMGFTGANPTMTLRTSGNVGIGTTAPGYALDITATGGIRIGRGTTAQRGVGATGYLGYNTTWNGYDVHDGAAFRRLLDLPDATPTSGHIPVYTGGAWTTNGNATATATLDFPSTSAHSSSDLTITVTGAAVGETVSIGAHTAPPANGFYFAWVSTTNTVTVRFINAGGGSSNPASASFTIRVHKI